MKYKPIPFSLDWNSKTSLTRQIELGLKRAILTGRLAPGDILPPREELAAMFGVSEIVSREAVRRLVAEGFVRSRPRIGSVVLARDAPSWKGRVVLVGANGDGGYYFSALGQELRRRLFDAGYLVADATVFWKPDGSYDASRIEPFLQEAVDMAVILTPYPQVLRQFAEAGVPLVSIDRSNVKSISQCLAFYGIDHDGAVRDMVRLCHAEGVKTVLDVWTWSRKRQVQAAIRRAGMSVKEWRIRALSPDKIGYIEGLQRGALEAFEKRLAAEGKAWLPDLLYIGDDDYLASGALSALLRYGVDVPGDVRVVTLANRGFGPVFHRPLARMEVDPVVHGNIIADDVLMRLGGTMTAPAPALPVTFIPGKTLAR